MARLKSTRIDGSLTVSGEINNRTYSVIYALALVNTIDAKNRTVEISNFISDIQKAFLNNERIDKVSIPESLKIK